MATDAGARPGPPLTGHGVYTSSGAVGIDSSLKQVSGRRMSRPNALSLQARTILELCAYGLSDCEVAARLQLSRRVVSEIRRDTAAKLAVRIDSAHPFHIREVMVARRLDSMEF